MSKSTKSASIYLLVLGSAAVFFLVDLLIPLGVAGGVPYILTVFLCLKYSSSRFALITAIGCTGLVLIGYLLSPDPGGAELWKVLVNRGLAIFAIWVTTLLGLNLHKTLSNLAALKEKEKKIEALNEDLRRSNTELERFAYVTAHDLQAPIRHVIGYSSLLLSETKENKNLTTSEDEKLNKIDHAARSMQKMLDALLQYARVGQAKINFEKVELDEVAKTATAVLRHEALKKKMDIHISSLPMVKGSQPLLAQVFQNLIGNAIKFGPQDGGVIKVQSTRNHKDYVVTVSDNGIGFDQKYAEKIFDIFRRIHKKEGYAGTGVGLAICKHVVEKHGGKIWAESSEGEGAKFSFSIPIASKIYREEQQQ